MLNLNRDDGRASASDGENSLGNLQPSRSEGSRLCDDDDDHRTKVGDSEFYPRMVKASYLEIQYLTELKCMK